MDPLSIFLSIETLLATALTLSDSIFAALGAIKEAPAHITALKNDLEDYYFMLGHLQGLICAERRREVGDFEVLENALRSSVAAFGNLKVLLNKFLAQDRVQQVGKWRSPKWMFVEMSIERFRRDLMDSKVTLNTEMAILTWSNTSMVSRTVDRIEADLLQHHQGENLHRYQLAERLENLEATRLSQSPSHTEADRANVRYDPDYSLRHHLDSAAASIISDGLEPSSASFIVSELGDTLETTTISDQDSFISAFSRPSHEIPPIPPSTTACTNPSPHLTLSLPIHEILIQTHTGTKLNVQITPHDTPQTVLSRLQELDGFWSYWSEKGYLMHDGKPIAPDQELRPFLGGGGGGGRGAPTFSFRAGTSMALFQVNSGGDDSSGHRRPFL